VPDEILPACVNQHVSIIRLNQNVCVPGYLLAFLTHPVTKRYIESFNTGGSRRAVTKGHIESFQVPLPPLPTQRRIAAILSAYDALIENNARRIAILEEMARRLYDEWFVRFRFPGHEKVKMVESRVGLVPDGWCGGPLASMCRAVEDGDWIESKDQGGEDYRLLQVSNVGLGRFVETGNFRYISEETFRRLRCREVLPGQILVSRMPDPVGRSWLVHEMPWRMVTAVDVAIVDPDPAKCHPLYLIQALNAPASIARAEQNASGTTRARITRRVLAALPFVQPPSDLQERFATLTAPQHELIVRLGQTNGALRSARDLLLPKLVSGEIDVFAAEEQAAEACA